MTNNTRIGFGRLGWISPLPNRPAQSPETGSSDGTAIAGIELGPFMPETRTIEKRILHPPPMFHPKSQRIPRSLLIGAALLALGCFLLQRRYLGSAEVGFARAWQSEQRGSLLSAARLYQKVVLRFPDSPKARAALQRYRWIQFQDHNPARAHALLDRWLELKAYPDLTQLEPEAAWAELQEIALSPTRGGIALALDLETGRALPSGTPRGDPAAQADLLRHFVDTPRLPDTTFDQSMLRLAATQLLLGDRPAFLSTLEAWTRSPIPSTTWEQTGFHNPPFDDWRLPRILAWIDAPNRAPAFRSNEIRVTATLGPSGLAGVHLALLPKASDDWSMDFPYDLVFDQPDHFRTQPTDYAITGADGEVRLATDDPGTFSLGILCDEAVFGDDWPEHGLQIERAPNPDPSGAVEVHLRFYPKILTSGIRPWETLQPDLGRAAPTLRWEAGPAPAAIADFELLAIPILSPDARVELEPIGRSNLSGRTAEAQIAPILKTQIPPPCFVNLRIVARDDQQQPLAWSDPIPVLWNQSDTQVVDDPFLLHHRYGQAKYNMNRFLELHRADQGETVFDQWSELELQGAGSAWTLLAELNRIYWYWAFDDFVEAEARLRKLVRPLPADHPYRPVLEAVERALAERTEARPLEEWPGLVATQVE